MNFYAYTNQSKLFPDTIKHYNGILVKFGETIRDPDTRMNEQGDASESEGKIKLKKWMNVDLINTDREVHALFKKLNYTSCGNGKGTEWFAIPANNKDDAIEIIERCLVQIAETKIRIFNEGIEKSTKNNLINEDKTTSKITGYENINKRFKRNME